MVFIVALFLFQMLQLTKTLIWLAYVELIFIGKLVFSQLWLHYLKQVLPRPHPCQPSKQ